jgi:hypothetical protein
VDNRKVIVEGMQTPDGVYHSIIVGTSPDEVIHHIILVRGEIIQTFDSHELGLDQGDDLAQAVHNRMLEDRAARG